MTYLGKMLPGQYPVYDGTMWRPGRIRSIELQLVGEYSAAVLPGFWGPQWLVEKNGTVPLRVVLSRRTAGTAGSTTVDVTRNGTTIWDNPGDRPEITAASGDDSQAVFTTFDAGQLTWTAGDVIEFPMITVETYLAGPPEGPEGLRLCLDVLEIS